MRFTQSASLASLFLAALFSNCLHAAKILMVPMPLGSHIRTQLTIAKELRSRGHEIHMLVSKHLPMVKEFTSGDDILAKKINKLHVYEDAAFNSVNALTLDEIHKMAGEKLWDNAENIAYLTIKYGFPAFETECRRMLENQDALFNELSETRFDLAIVDGLYMMKCIFLVPHRLKLPWITIADTVEPWLVRTPYISSFVPVNLAPFSERMSFFERCINFLLSAALELITRFPGPPNHVLDSYRKHGGDFRDLNDLASRSLLWLTNRHVVSDYAKPSMPNIVDIGGQSLTEISKPLPSDMEQFVQSSEDGVILFTFGSMVDDIPETVSRKFNAAFAGLPRYRIFWRFDNYRNESIAPNVFVSKWLPQADILAHPKTKLFITHGGNNGQMEAIYYAKPMIAFALFGDQPYNVRRMSYKGYGREMDIHSFTPDELILNIVEVIKTPSYAAQIKRASEIFHSDVQRPAEKVVWWIEHVIKFGGDHLRSAGNDLYWFQYWLIDVVLFFFITIVAMVVCTCATCRRVCRICCGSRNKMDEKLAAGSMKNIDRKSKHE